MIGRRAILLGGGTLMTTGAMAEDVAWRFSFPAIEGGTLDLGRFRGRVLLVVNTASFCGYTPQYDALQALHTARAAAGLTVIGVPSGDFNQESADNATVKTFCETRFGIDFPLAEISKVKGAQAAAFYAWVKRVKGWEPSWNFNKVLIGRDGRIVATYGARERPDGPKITAAITAAIAVPLGG